MSKTATGRQAHTELAKPHEPTPAERAALAAYVDKKKKRTAPRVTVKAAGGIVNVSTDHPDPSIGNVLVMHSIGTADPEFFDSLLGQLINLGMRDGKPDERALNFMLSVIKAVEPKDELETMLAAQMATIHLAILTFARRLACARDIAQQDSAANAYNKLTRTFAVQMEALKRYRTGGEQRVTVQHVTVNEGGQAIVGSVSAKPGGTGGPENQKAAP